MERAKRFGLAALVPALEPLDRIGPERLGALYVAVQRHGHESREPG